MSCPAEACEAASLIEKISSPRRGGLKSYRPGHVVILLKLLRAQGPLGRPRLTRLLSLGEASIKTLLSELEKTGLVERSGRGHILTEKGENILSAIEDTISLEEVEVSIFDTRSLRLVIACVDPPRNLTQVYLLRDYLVAAGCTRSVIGGYVEGEIRYPGVPEDIVELLKSTSVNRGVNIYAPLECQISLIDSAINLILRSCS